MKPLVRHERADLDVEEAVEYYLQHAPEVALPFIDALEQTYRQIQQRPAIVWRVLHGSRDIPAWLQGET